MDTSDRDKRYWRSLSPWLSWGGVGFAFLLLSACNTSQLPSNNELSTFFGHGDICGLPTVATSNFLLLLTAGLFAGFSHCIGMCGPLVTTFVLRRQANRQTRAESDTLTPLVIYQVGRLTSYVGLGVVTGTVGSLVRVNVVGSGWQGNLSIAIGALMVLTGLSLWGVLPWLRWIESARYAHGLGQTMRGFLQSDHPLAPLGLGLANGLLPCGAVYAMALVATTSGNPFQGAMIMFAFGLGTLPAMLGITFLAMRLSLGLRSNLYRFAALLVMVVGLQLTLRGLAVTGAVPHLTFSGVALW